jgi:NAD(P)-dependent dehydrogenase (short-subunit alcohol dehydrogenase family)
MDLSDATCVVTGAGSAIGAATVAELLACGAGVVAVDATAEALAALDAGGARVVVADVTTEEGRDRVFTSVPGATHLVIAGGISVACPIEEVTGDYWDCMVAANTKSAFFLMQRFCPAMPTGGAVVNVTSVAGKTSRSPEVAVYSASHAAVLSLTRAFANVYASRQVRVNAICTGIIETPENDRYLKEVAALRGAAVEEVAAMRYAVVPMGRPGTPAECARAIRHLLSDDAGFVTGQAINVTGGFHNY